MLYIAAFLLAAAALLAVGARSRDARRIRARLAALDPIPAREGASGLPILPRILSLLSVASRLERAGWRADGRMLLIAIIALGAILAAGYAMSWLAGLGLLLAVAFAVYKLLAVAIRRREERFLRALPSFLEHMRQSVAAGNGLHESFLRAFTVGPQICREQFQPVLARAQMGATLTAAMQAHAERTGIKELFILSIILQTQQRYGGSFYEALTNLIGVLRAREQTRREFKAISSEIRSSAGVLACLPILVALVILFAKPKHFEFFLTAPGSYIGFGAIALLACGMAIIRRLAALRY